MIGIPLRMRNLFIYNISDYFSNGFWNVDIDFCNAYSDINDDIRKHRFIDGAKDVRIWEKSLHGDLSSKVSYIMLSPNYPDVNWGNWICQPFITVCRSTTTWKAIHNRLLTWNMLISWGFSWCSLCHSNEEDMDHLSHSLLVSFCQIFGFCIAHITDFNYLLLQAMILEATSQVLNAWKFVVGTYIWMKIWLFFIIRPLTLWIFISDFGLSLILFFMDLVIHLLSGFYQQN